MSGSEVRVGALMPGWRCRPQNDVVVRGRVAGAGHRTYYRRRAVRFPVVTAVRWRGPAAQGRPAAQPPAGASAAAAQRRGRPQRWHRILRAREARAATGLDVRFISQLTSGTYGADPGRRPRQPADAAHRLARQAGRAVRRQVPHHRLPAVQLRQLGHPPHRRRHAVQVAQPDPPPAARLELPRRALRRSSSTCCRPSSGSARTAGTRAPPTRCTRTSTSCASNDPEYVLILAGDHVYKMDYGQHARRPRRQAGAT